MCFPKEKRTIKLRFPSSKVASFFLHSPLLYSIYFEWDFFNLAAQANEKESWFQANLIVSLSFPLHLLRSLSFDLSWLCSLYAYMSTTNSWKFQMTFLIYLLNNKQNLLTRIWLKRKKIWRKNTSLLSRQCIQFHTKVNFILKHKWTEKSTCLL